MTLMRLALKQAVWLAVLVVATHAPRATWAQMWNDVSEVVEIEVLPGWRADGGRHVAGLALRLTPGWKTYWRSPGSTGIAPRLDWRRSDNARAVTARWPRPRVFDQPAGRAIGYDADFVLPLIVQARDPDAPVRLAGRLDIGVCLDVCLPARIDVAAVLPAGGTMDARIAAALGEVPRRIDAAATCDLTPTAEGVALDGRIALAPLGGAETVVFEMPGEDVWISDSRTVRRDGGLSAAAEILPAPGRALAIDRGRIRMTVIGAADAVEIVGCDG